VGARCDWRNGTPFRDSRVARRALRVVGLARQLHGAITLAEAERCLRERPLEFRLLERCVEACRAGDLLSLIAAMSVLVAGDSQGVVRTLERIAQGKTVQSQQALWSELAKDLSECRKQPVTSS